MGTYTTNKNLYMPTVGETGWGTLVNENFSTIDNFLKPITVSGSTYTFTGNHVGNQSGGTITATKITNSGTLTNTGKITGNGGIAGTTGTFSGAVTGASFNGATITNTTFNDVDIGACTFTVSTTDSTSYTSIYINRLNPTGSSGSSVGIAAYTPSSSSTDFGTITGTLRFMIEDDYKLYQFSTAILPSSGITYKISTRPNATLTIDGLTCTSAGTDITRTQAIRLLTQRVNYTIKTSGTSTNDKLLSLTFTNTTSERHYIWFKCP